MKTEKNILTAFLLNLGFSVFEFAGGIFTGSVAVMSDAIHDMGDAAGIGISFLLEKKSRKDLAGTTADKVFFSIYSSINLHELKAKFIARREMIFHTVFLRLQGEKQTAV